MIRYTDRDVRHIGRYAAVVVVAVAAYGVDRVTGYVPLGTLAAGVVLCWIIGLRVAREVTKWLTNG